MTFDQAELARKDKPHSGKKTPRSGKDVVNVTHSLNALAEMGLTNVLGVALPDPRNLKPEQKQTVIAAYSAIQTATQTGGAGLWGAIGELVAKWSAHNKASESPPAPAAAPAEPPAKWKKLQL